MDGVESTSDSNVLLRPLLPTVDQRVRGFYWGSRGLRPWEEVQLYFKIVACHASHLADLFERRASQFVKLRETCESLSTELKLISQRSMALYRRNRRQFSKLDGLSHLNKHLSRCAWETTFWLRSCIKDLRYFDSFCHVIRPQPGMELISWEQIQLETLLANAPKHKDFHGSGDDVFHTIAESAFESLLKSERYALVAAGLKSLADFSIDSSSWHDWNVILNSYSIVRVIDMPWRNDTDASQIRQYPRDIELEVASCYDHVQVLETRSNLFEKPVQEEPPIIANNNMSGKRWGGFDPHYDLQAQPLVSINNGRPKRKHVSFINNWILVGRVPWGDFSFLECSEVPWGVLLECSEIPEEDILFVTQRESVVQSLTLTVFFWTWSGNDRVHTFEMGFHDQKSLDTWLLRLAKMGSWYISA